MTTAASGTLIKRGLIIMLAIGMSACAGTPPGVQASQASGNTGCDITGSRIASSRNCTDPGLVSKGSVASGSGTGVLGNGAGAGAQQGAAASGH
jgi:hypothetical protein